MSVLSQNQLTSILLVLLSTVACPGCKYDGSMLQMNSDSPSPFLGLQWSVKNEPKASKQPDLPVRLVRADYAKTDEIMAGSDESVELTAPLIPAKTMSNSGRPANFVPTSDTQRTTGRVRYSLERASDPNTNLADEMSLRLRQF